MRPTAKGIAALLTLSALLLAIAPAFLPPSYSWRANGISESAAQGVDGAWAARAGFLLFGLAVLWLAATSGERWHLAARACHLALGTSMLAVAAFSTRSWEDGTPYVHSEDLLHSIFATAMGFAFIGGTTSLAFGPTPSGARHPPRERMVHLGAAGAACALSAAMGLAPAWYGLWQRAMFAVGYLWFGREALGQDRSAGG